MQLEADLTLTFDTEEPVQQTEPLDQSVIPSEGSKRNIVVRWLEAQNLKSLLR